MGFPKRLKIESIHFQGLPPKHTLQIQKWEHYTAGQRDGMMRELGGYDRIKATCGWGSVVFLSAKKPEVAPLCGRHKGATSCMLSGRRHCTVSDARIGETETPRGKEMRIIFRFHQIISSPRANVKGSKLIAFLLLPLPVL